MRSNRSIALQPEDVRMLLAAQLVLVILLTVALVFISGLPEAEAAAYGGATALTSAWILGFSVRKAAHRARTAPGSETPVLYIGAVVRFVMVLVMFGLGMGVLQLAPGPLLGGFIIAQFGHLINGSRISARAHREAEKLG
ncbi:MAG: ATP synthase subunit I [Gammaproteobacteria bacterium]|nr:ATP synthase subunit I [Gammaproteobacteria bacterium]